VTDGAGHCSFCGATRGPFAKVEGLFTVLICIPCLEVRQAQPNTHLGLHDPGPYPAMTRADMRASLQLLPSCGSEPTEILAKLVGCCAAESKDRRRSRTSASGTCLSATVPRPASHHSRLAPTDVRARRP
jgi:hypothetical protein